MIPYVLRFARVDLIIGSISRKLRILPPQTQYFSTSALRFPHSAEAAEKDLHTVAPGMACEVTITFAPDTEGIYRDIVRCITETVDFEVSWFMQIQFLVWWDQLPTAIVCGFVLHCFSHSRFVAGFILIFL